MFQSLSNINNFVDVGTSNPIPATIDPREAERAGDAYQEEIVSYTNTERVPTDVDFDDMVSDRPSFFPRVTITTKTKPRASLVPESTSAPPQATASTPSPTIPLAKIPLMLKRLAREPPASDSQPGKRVKIPAPKKVPQAPIRGSREEATQPMGGGSRVGLVPQHSTRQKASVMELDSSTAILDHYGERDPAFAYKVSTIYAPLKDPFATFAQSAKHMNEALNEAYILAKRADRPTHKNRNATKKIEILRVKEAFAEGEKS
ncbi:hypothetical protein LIER_02037 [Lithospermum erythrorhizon]|uniref:Uncharacterized protein n=1 Tax=Lithospermum erythrorhizon TaxID=34254 RepID=A0AAV3NSR2_LITER